MCVLTALRLHDGNDRDELFLCLLRIKFWVLIFISRGLDKAAVLSYNTTPAERGSTILYCDWPHVYHLFLWSWPHVEIGVLILYSICFSSLPAEEFSSASTARNWWPHDYHSVLGFDHIFDHKQIRSTRRQECTRVWKSRFCVAERAKKSKNG